MPQPTERFDEEIGPRPAAFDAEWAKFVLASRDAGRPKPWFERVGVIIALLASLAGAVTSCVNLALFRADRDARIGQQDLDNQVSWAKMYFEKVIDTQDFCQVRENAAAFARVARNAAVARQTDSVGMRELATIIEHDAAERARPCGARDVEVPPAPGQVRNVAPPAPNVTTSYQIQQQVSPADASRPAGLYTIYLHYPQGETAGQARAEGMSRLMRTNTELRGRFRVPGIEGVRSPVLADQIRIYRAVDAPVAHEIARLLGLEQATIINLESAYPSLPERTMEIWLSAR